jgi:4-hydroxy-tetrahydrodipicolinate reductase
MNIALIGYGKMGKAIEEVALHRGHTMYEIVGSDRSHHLDELLDSEVDVAIEFTNPESAFENISKCIEKGIPVVSGTTGWLERWDDMIEQVKQNDGALFYASNFSIGVNIFFELNRKAAEMMSKFEEYDVSVTEIHHTEKKDSPSGTAITLAEGILEYFQNKRSWVNAKSEQNDVLNIISKREPEVPGTHEITYEGSIDSICLKHTAFSRMGFAKGAVAASEWLVGKKGIFGMKDLMKNL